MLLVCHCQGAAYKKKKIKKKSIPQPSWLEKGGDAILIEASAWFSWQWNWEDCERNL